MSGVIMNAFMGEVLRVKPYNTQPVCDPVTALKAGSNMMDDIQHAVLNTENWKHSTAWEWVTPLMWQRRCWTYLRLPRVHSTFPSPAEELCFFFSFCICLDCGVQPCTVSLSFWHGSLSPHHEAFIQLLSKNLSSSCALYAQDSRCWLILSWTTKL